MKFNFIHTNFNVLNLEKSMAFYEKALGLKEALLLDTADFFKPQRLFVKRHALFQVQYVKVRVNKIEFHG